MLQRGKSEMRILGLAEQNFQNHSCKLDDLRD